MPFATKARLCAMMFLNYFIWGAWYVTLNTYLTQTLKFSGTQAGWIFGAVALSCMVSPFFVGLVADRLLASEKTLALVHLLGAITMFAASRITDFWPLYFVLLAHCLCYMPTLALTNTLALRQMQDPGREFPIVRMFGTLGWIAIGWLVGSMKVEASATPFLIAAASSLAMSAYSLTLPHTPPQASGAVSVKTALGLDALAMLKDRSFAVLALASLLACIPLTFYFSFTNAFLNERGVENAAGKMTYGQAAEVVMMLLMPFIFKRVSVKGILLMGLAAWTIRYLLLAAGDPGGGVWMFYLAIALHGICYDFFFMTGQLYTDQQAPRHLRGAAQGFIQFVTYGVGMYVGSLLSGGVLDLFTKQVDGNPVRDWVPFWITAAGAAAVIFVLIAFFFSGKGRIQPSPAQEPEPRLAEAVGD